MLGVSSTAPGTWQARRARIEGPPRLAAARTPDDTGWRTDDLMWELAAERAARDAHAGHAAAVAAHFDEMLRIASDHFAVDDPRLAASLANVALALDLSGRAHQATRHLERALMGWEDCWRWLARHEVPRADASPLVRLASARTRELLRHRLVAGADHVDAWDAHRPQRFTDLRKLRAAVLLLAPVIERDAVRQGPAIGSPLTRMAASG